MTLNAIALEVILNPYKDLKDEITAYNYGYEEEENDYYDDECSCACNDYLIFP